MTMLKLIALLLLTITIHVTSVMGMGNCTLIIQSFTIVNDTTRFDISPLRDFFKNSVNETIAIRANPESCIGTPKVNSVLVDLDNSLFKHCETYLPYSIFRDPSTKDKLNEDAFYRGYSLSLGRHNVSATPYDGENCKGTAGPKLTKSFVVRKPGNCELKIESFTLVNSTTKTDISPLQSFIKNHPNETIAIRANPGPCINGTSKVRSVLVDLDGSMFKHCETYTPYTIFRDPSTIDKPNDKASYNGVSLSIGRHNVSATPYDGENCTGIAGRKLTKSFAVRNPPRVPVPVPVAVPMKAPVRPPARVPTIPTPIKIPVSVPYCTSNAQCSDSNVCNGSELCELVSGVCKSGVPLDCDDNNFCTIDTCNPITGCIHTPVECGVNEACNLRDGTCVPATNVRPCIAVIDESDTFSDFDIDAKWATFRTNWPDRPFCLLQPLNPSYSRLYLPTSPDFISDPLNTFAIVNRDNGDPDLASDWLGACGYSTTDVEFIGLFIDNSGSMTIGTVQASLDKFDMDLAEAELTYCSVFNPSEDWITPFDTLLGSIGGGGACDVP